MTRLKHLTLEKIVDTAYLCGIDKIPVSVLLVTPPGGGKTWSTSALADTDFVAYMTGVYSPNEHRKRVQSIAPRLRLLINDDMGLTARWNQAEYFSTFCMIIDGHIHFTVYKSTIEATIAASLIVCCTSDYYRQNKDRMQEMGLLDRMVPVVLGLSDKTRKKYQESYDNATPPPRDPVIPDFPPEPKREMLAQKDIDPRLLRNLNRMSRYLTEEELSELIEVSHSDGRGYEI